MSKSDSGFSRESKKDDWLRAEFSEMVFRGVWSWNQLERPRVNVRGGSHSTEVTEAGGAVHGRSGRGGRFVPRVIREARRGLIADRKLSLIFTFSNG